MKTIHYIFLFVGLSFFAQAQTIRRVTNDPNIPLGTNMYRTLQAAHDAATAGDIIYVQSSYRHSGNSNGESYGNLTSTKKLHIIGNGYKIDENIDLFGSNAPYNTASSIVGDIIINFGNETIIEGLQIGSINSKAKVTVRRCYIINNIALAKLSVTQDPSGSIISQNKLGSLSIGVENNQIGPVSNITVTNNILSIINNLSNINFTNLPRESFVTNVIIRNNSLDGIVQISNAQVSSNIFYYTPQVQLPGGGLEPLAYVYYCPNIVGSNNVCIGEPCRFGSNNTNGPFEIALFGFANGGLPTIPRHHILSNSSPAKGAGLGGVDAGPFGTADPFRLSGLPAIPQITSYSSQISNSIYTPSTPMNVTISVRGNN